MGKELFALYFDNWAGILLALVPAIINLALSVYVRFRLPRTETTRFFTLLTLAIAFWQCTDAFTRMSTSTETAALWDAVFSTGWILVAPLSLHFCLAFTDRKISSSSILLIFLYLPAFAFDALYKVNYETHPFAYLKAWGWVNARSGSFLDAVLLLWMGSLIIITAALFYIHAYKMRNNPNAFKCALLIAIGYTIPALQGIITEAIFPLIFNMPALPLTSTTMCLFSAAVVWGLKKYQLFQVPDFINKQLLLDTMDDIVITFTHEKQVTYINNNGAKILGVDKNNLSEYRLGSFFASEKAYMAFLENAFGTETTKTFDAQLKCSEGNAIETQVILKKINQHGSYNYLAVARNVTIQKAAQEQLKLNEERFKALIEKSSDGLFTINEKSELLYTSPSCERILGYAKNDLQGKNIFSFIHPDDFASAHDHFSQILASQSRSISCVVRWKHQHGHWVWLDCTSTNLLHEKAVNAIVINCRNVTARRFIEKEREETLALFNSIISHNIDGILIEDSRNHVIWTNTTFCRVFDIKLNAEELVGHIFTDVVSDKKYLVANHAQFLDKIKELQSQKQVVLKHEIELLDGSVYEMDYMPVYTQQNMFVGHLWKFHNVTDRVNTLKKIQNQTAYIQQLYDASPYGIVMLDNNDCVINANAAFEEMFQYSTAEMYGKAINDLIVPDMLHDEATHISSSCYQKRIIQIESQRKRKDGSLMDVLIVGYPIVIDSMLSGIYGIYADITERKRAEMELITNNLELQKINKELDMFVYSASHDIRAPLMSLLGLINLAEVETEDPSLRQYLTMMRTSISKLDEFVTEIIHYSKNARVSLNLQPVDLDAIVEEVFSNLKYHEGSSNITLNFRNNVTQEFYTDSARLYNVLNNLVSNAIKYHNYLQPEPHISICAEILADKLHISVSDNGAGIAPELQDRVFDMFFRASEKSTGSGLGLYIAREMVEKMKGTIHFTSEHGKGTTFYIDLPNTSSIAVQISQPQEAHI